MKKSLLTLLLALVAAATAQQAPSASGAATQQQPGAAAPQQQQKKEIKDPAEYNAYMAASSAQDPAQKAAQLESFLSTYPNSVMKEDATELLLKAYQQQNNIPKMTETAQKLLQANPNNLTALALLAYYDHAQALQGGANSAQLLTEGGQWGTRGLQALQTAPKPEGYTDDQWAKMKETFRSIFNVSAGHAAYAAKDYPTAQKELKEAVAANPNDLQTVYLLALSYLDPKPPVVDGLFWIARATALAPTPQAQQQLGNYGKRKYTIYHGSDEGWDQLVAQAKTQTDIPAGFTVAPAPSPAEQAADMVKKTTPDKMSFAEWQFIFTSGNPQASETVWNAVKGKGVKMVASVISATPKTLLLAGSEDDIQAKTADIELTLTTALPAARVPKPGAEVTFQGVPTEYTANPFLMKMGEGLLLTKAGTAVEETKPAAPRRRNR